MAQQSVETSSGKAFPPGRQYRGAALRHVAMPLGGVGAGQVAICGDGALRQWELFHLPNHLAFVPDSFFAISAATGDESVTRILQSREVLDLPEARTPMVNDDHIPTQQRALLDRFPGVDRTVFTGAYPFARIDYEDAALPVDTALEAYAPFVPTDVEASDLPAVVFTFHIHNPTDRRVRGKLGATLKNVVGWDGVVPIERNACPSLGGNVNRVVREAGYTALALENPSLPERDPGQGQLALATTASDVTALPQWSDPGTFMDALNAFSGSEFLSKIGTKPSAPSGPGEAWNGGLIVPFDLRPGASSEVTFVLAWSFPNHYVNFGQSGHHDDTSFTRSQLWLGTAYAGRFRDALAVVDHVVAHGDRLHRDSRAWADSVLTSSLPTWLSEFLAAQGALLRSPTTFRTEDGTLFGFEGTQGAPTSNLPWAGFGGSCPLNCTHVWNYEQTLSRLFPALERTMRETDFDYVQAPEGFIPHRTVVPLTMRQLWDRPIGGPDNPALDGMLGTILKAYREVRQGAGCEWLVRYWPNVKRLLAYIEGTWDPDGDGILDGEQPNTFDIAFYGPNMFIGALWLAALRAAEEMARQLGEATEADRLRARFAGASKAYDDLLWNGEYYVQIRDESAPPEQQYGPGCLSDQLLGQWWAHQLGLGYILPEAHVRETLRNIVRHNFRAGFHDWEPQEREFATGDDAGLMNVTWPHGGQPEVPTRYWDEVWTGTEYQVAAHCIMEGLVAEGMQVVEAARARYDGSKRNPYNDIECGDHYARAMSGWTILEAIAGYRYDAATGAMTFRPVDDPALVGAAEAFRAPFVAATGWGRYERINGRQEIAVLYGEVRLLSLSLPAGGAARVNGQRIDTSPDQGAAGVTLRFPEELVLTDGDRLVVENEDPRP